MLDSIESAIEDLKKGKIIVVVDDENRENEGDLLMVAEFAEPEDVNFMTLYGRGLICAPMTQERADNCLLYTSPSPRDGLLSRMPSSA